MEVAYEPGEVVIRQGDIGQDFFIISKGQCVVLYQVDDERAPVKVLAKIGANCFFGELALMTDEARSATIAGPTASLRRYSLRVSRSRDANFSKRWMRVFSIFF